jgi:protein-S-isoprenylcysteine O-methyltransferase Ste14
MNIAEDSAKVRFPPPLVYLGFLLLGFAGDRILALDPLPLSEALRYGLCAGLVIFGAILALSAIKLFRAIDTDEKPWRPTTGLAMVGIYRFTRNPMYLGMAATYLGLALALASIGALILFPLLILAIRTQVIAREERYLDAKFGEEYAAYKAQVRRWF